MKRIVLIEDDKKKIEDINGFIQASFDVELTIKESYQSGLRALIFDNYDLLLLDMSIPTWDRKPNESGGDFEKFGGYKILKEIIRKNRPINTVLVTMFDDFGESDRSMTLSELDEALDEEFKEIYLGSVYYSSRENKWKDELKEIIEKQLQ